MILGLFRGGGFVDVKSIVVVRGGGERGRERERGEREGLSMLNLLWW